MRIDRHLLTLIAAVFLLARAASAQTWVGLGANDNWGTALNWNTGVAPVNNGTANLIFGGTTRLSPAAEVQYSINSITFNNTAGAFTLGSSALGIGAGGIVNNDADMQTINNSINVNATQVWAANFGPLTFNSLMSINSASILTFSAGTGASIISGGIAGTGSLTKTGGGTLTLSGGANNVFSGPLTVNAGTVIFNKTPGLRAFGGSLIIGDGSGSDIVQYAADDQANNPTVTINSSGVLDMNGFDDVFSTLAITGGGVTIGTGTLQTATALTMTGGSITSSGAGKLQLNSPLTTNANSTTATIINNVDLGGSVRILTVADGAASDDLEINGAISNGQVTKAGAGTLRLSGTTSNSGPLNVTAGTVNLAKAGVSTPAVAATSAMSITGATVNEIINNQIDDLASVTVSTGGLLDLNNNSDTIGSLNMNNGTVQTGSGTLSLSALSSTSSTSTATISGRLGLLGGSRSFNIGDSALAVELDISAAIINGALEKINTGTLRLSGATANALSEVTVSGGTLLLNKTGLNGAIPGNLVIGDGAGGDTVRLESSNQIADSSNITINVGGFLDLNGQSDTVGPITLEQGSISTGIGTLTVAGNISTTASNNQISGNLTISGPRTINVDNGPGSIDLFVTANIAGGPITLNGPGEISLAGNNNAQVILNSGILEIASNTALGAGTAIFNGGTIRTFGSRTLSNPMVFNGAVTIDLSNALTLNGAISGGGAVTKTGTDLLLITAANAINGPWILNAGTINAPNLRIDSFGSLTINAGQFTGALNNGGTLTYNNGSFNASLINQGTFNINSLSFTASGGVTNTANISMGPGLLFSAAGSGLLNNGQITLNGATINAAAPVINNGEIRGHGAITGPFAFSNNGLITQEGGNLELSSTTSQSNFGNIEMAAGRQLNIFSTPLSNSGTINLNSGTISGTQALINNFDGAVTGRGTILAPFANNGLLLVEGGSLKINNAFDNTATIAINGLGSTLTGGAISNSGTIQGNGSVSNNINNTGTIEAVDGTLILASASIANTGTINASTGNKIILAAATTNAGVINLTGGTFDGNNHALTNTGQISGYGTFRAGSFTNNGTMTFSGGTSTINGNVINNVGHQIRVAFNPAIFTGNVTNNGIFKNTSTTITFAGTYTENGTFISDPADNFFASVNIGANGAWVGGLGDRFFVNGDLLNSSTNKSGWQTTDAELRFTGGIRHLLSAIGEDRGISFDGYDNNFAWGVLTLDRADQLTLQGNGALYVRELNLAGGLAQISSITGNGSNIYYHLGEAANAYLGGQTYALAGGGSIVAVPEPATLISGVLMTLLTLRRRRKHHVN